MSMIKHFGAHGVTREELAAIKPPDGTDTWFPIKHHAVLQKVEAELSGLDIEVTRTELAVAKEGMEFFATLDLSMPLLDAENLSIGVRNSNNKRFPMGFCIGRRATVCDNLVFSSDVVISKRHTRHGEERYDEGISHGIAQMPSYQEVEARRIEQLTETQVSATEADALILQAAEKKLISWRQAPKVLEQWRKPTFEEHAGLNRYCLLQAFTEVLKTRFQRQPLKAASESIAIQNFLGA